MNRKLAVKARLTRCNHGQALIALESPPFNGLEFRPAQLRDLAHNLLTVADLATRIPLSGKHWQPREVTIGEVPKLDRIGTTIRQALVDGDITFDQYQAMVALRQTATALGWSPVQYQRALRTILGLARADKPQSPPDQPGVPGA